MTVDMSLMSDIVIRSDLQGALSALLEPVPEAVIETMVRCAIVSAWFMLIESGTPNLLDAL